MQESGFWVVLLAMATTVDGLLAGASADQSIEQLPARHQIGVRAYLAYSQVSHMANGRFWLIPLGLGGPLLRVIATLWGSRLSLSADRSLPLYMAAIFAVAHVLSTAKAGRINWVLAPWQPADRWAHVPWPLDRKIDDESKLVDTFRQFERWQAVRASLQFMTFVAGVWALAVAQK